MPSRPPRPCPGSPGGGSRPPSPAPRLQAVDNRRRPVRAPVVDEHHPNAGPRGGESQETPELEAALLIEARHDEDEVGDGMGRFAIESTPARPAEQLLRGLCSREWRDRETRNHHVALDGWLGGNAPALTVAAQAPSGARAAELQKWGVHDESRPMPPVGRSRAGSPPAPVPADAIVLFDGKDLSGWTTAKGAPAKWVVKDGYMEAVKGAGSIQTTAQLRRLPTSRGVGGAGARVGSARTAATAASFSMNTYEVQVLDSYEATTTPTAWPPRHSMANTRRL